MYKKQGYNLCNLTEGGDGHPYSSPKSWKAVSCYELDGTFIKKFKSLTEASKEYKCSTANISGCCKGHFNSIKGKIWRYADEEIPDNYILNKAAKPILQYSLNGEFIKEYNSIIEAAKHFKCKAPNISRVLRGERSHFRKFKFKYKDIV